MRILFLSAMFPPNALGGAELSAYSLASWLVKQGHEIGVLMAAKSPDEQKYDTLFEGMRVWSIYMPRPYPIFRQGRANIVLKPLWHLQDHLDPRNASIAAHVLDTFCPEFCSIQYLGGLGHNVMREIGRRDIPAMYVLHDLVLPCYKMTMYRAGKNCEKQCFLCHLSASFKLRQIRSVRRLGFCSPSKANLEIVAKYLAIENYPKAHILNVNKIPVPTITKRMSGIVRLIYVGRLQKTKGVEILLTAAERLSEKWKFTLKVVGDGVEAAYLKSRFGHHPWLDFTGHVPPQVAINLTADSDLLCLPSVWQENSPGVVIQALAMGIPVIGSNIGGVPELVAHDETGLLTIPGDVDSLHDSLSMILSDPPRLERYKKNAAARTHVFEQDYLGQRYLDFTNEICNFTGV